MHPLYHSGMRKLRNPGQYTGIGYTYHGDSVWRMAYAQAKCVTFCSHVQKATGRESLQPMTRKNTKQTICIVIHSLVILHPSRTIYFSSCSMLLFFVLRAGPAQSLPERQIGHAPLNCTYLGVMFGHDVDHVPTNKLKAGLSNLFFFSICFRYI